MKGLDDSAARFGFTTRTGAPANAAPLHSRVGVAQSLRSKCWSVSAPDPGRLEDGRTRGHFKAIDLEVLSALASALESRARAMKGHLDRSRALTEKAALRLALDQDTIRVARYAAILHDIGKVGIPHAILNKPGKLNGSERKIMQRHPEIGADLLSGISGFERVRAAVLAHHERHDGQGYPAGTAGEEIPIEARLISVVDSYDAMTNDRPYRRALSHGEAMRRLDAGSGSQFDPLMVEAVQAVVSQEQLTCMTARC